MITTSLALALLAQGPAVPAPQPVPFDRRAAEHLLNRAGFGAGEREIAAAVERGLAATLDALFEPAPTSRAAFEPENLAQGGVLGAATPAERARRRETTLPRADDDAQDAMEGSAPDAEVMEAERRAEIARRRAADARQLADYAQDWLAAMVLGEDPLRDRMTLFWHGHFTSSMQTVRSSHALIRQHQFLRANALGDFRALLVGMLSDPAMLVYLDNHRNARGRLNENLARELLELFTLGEGHYTESDVREAARALTGRTAVGGEFAFLARRHERGEKTVLGVTGPFGGEELVDVLLAAPRAADFLAEELLTWFEGVPAAPERVRAYAEMLREADWELAPVLRRVFEDAEFYGDDVVGARVASPVDFLIGSARRLGVEPPPRALEQATRLLGERLFHPPSVKGWESGEAWVSSAALLARGNVAGVLTGSIGAAELLGAEAQMDDVGERRRPLRARDIAVLAGRDPALVGLGRAARNRWDPSERLAALASDTKDDGELVDAMLEELLAIAPPSDTRAELLAYVADRREVYSLPEGSVGDWNEDGRMLLAHLAHRILALPEAQLH